MSSKEQRLTELELLLDEVRKQLLDAQIHFDIWEQLWPTEENARVLNAFRGFFTPTRNAHLDRFFIKVSNVVSNDPTSPSFYRLINMLSVAPSLAPGIDIRSLRSRLKKEKGLLARIWRYRNRRAAHWDMDVSEPLVPVQLGESRQMLMELEELFNEINRAHAIGHGWMFQPVERSDTRSLLSSLRQMFPSGSPKVGE